MTVCKPIGNTKRKVCAGDLRIPIKIQARVIQTKSNGGYDYDESFTDVVSMFASVDTKRGFSSFNDVGINPVTGSTLSFTHIFYIRYSPSIVITSENWLSYNNEKYIINSVENLDERNEYLALYCIKKGKQTKKGNFA